MSAMALFTLSMTSLLLSNPGGGFQAGTESGTSKAQNLGAYKIVLTETMLGVLWPWSTE